jgi:serine/threonine-protein kinase HipA
MTPPELAETLRLSNRTVTKYLLELVETGRMTQAGANYQWVDLAKRCPQCLFVYKKRQMVGYLYFPRRLSGSRYEFLYANEYLGQTDAEPLAVDMPLTTELLTSESIFKVFEQVIPEGLDRKLLESKAKSANAFDLLPWLQEVYGDLQFAKTKLPVNGETSHYTLNYAEVKTEILDENTFPNVLNLALEIDDGVLFPKGIQKSQFRPSGLSGYQHKLSVVMNHHQVRQVQAKEKGHSEYFLKPYNRSKANPDSHYYMPHLAINEHLFMTFAKNELGFEVPWSGLIKKPDDTEYHYLVKRYDRYQGEKISYTEVATLVGLDSETKYQMTSERLFTDLKPFLTKEERLILLKYYFYSLLIVHEDMHTKNLAVRTEGGKHYMAPLYDIATTAIYQGYVRETALLINGKDRHIRPEDFYKLVELIEIQPKIFDKEATNMLSQYTHQLPKYFDQLEEKLPGVMFYKRKRVGRPDRKPRVIQTMSLMERLRRKHQERIKQLDNTGWYKYLGLIQMPLF